MKWQQSNDYRRNEYSMFVEEFLHVNILEVNSEHGTAKTSDAEGIRFATVPQIGKSGVPQVRVGIVGRAMRLIGNHTHFRAIQE